MNAAVLQIAERVRSAAERVTGSKTLRNRCVPASIALRDLLTEAGIFCSVSWGYFHARPGPRPHAWVSTSSTSIDLTATQFRRNAPRVLVQSLAPTDRSVEILAVDNYGLIMNSTPYMLRLADKIKSAAIQEVR